MATLVPEVRSHLAWKKAVRRVHRAERAYATHSGKLVRKYCIDPGIRETIIALNALGFVTGASCEGHVSRPGGCTAYPWVLITSKFVERLDKSRRWRYLCNKRAHEEEKKRELMSQEERREYEQMDMIRRKAEREIKAQVHGLLREFYSLKPVRGTPRLVLHPVMFHLKPKPVLHDWYRSQRGRIRENRIRIPKFREEMRRFTEFLERKIMEKLP